MVRLKKAQTEWVQLARVCHVATADPAAIPTCAPVSAVFEAGRIYFASQKSSKKVRNLRRNPHVAVVFDDYSESWSGRRGIILNGEARIIERGGIFQRIRRLIYAKFPQYKRQAAIREGSSVIVGITPRQTYSWGL